MNLNMPQLGTDMIQIEDKEIVITLMYSQSSQKILFVEAEKEFVDLLFGFLTLPIGCAVKLLVDSELRVPQFRSLCIHRNGTVCLILKLSRSEGSVRARIATINIRSSRYYMPWVSCADALVTPKTVGAISNVFKSVQRLEAEETHKKILTDRKPGYGLRCLATESEIGLSREPISNSQDYYTCGASSHCSFVSPRYGAKCPRHQKKMTLHCTMMDGNDMVSIDKHHDYVKSSSKYFVTDNLEIFPSSQSLVLLQKLNVENMSSLYSFDLQVNTDEVLQLLGASLISGNVLNDVFGKSIRDRYAVAAPYQEINSQRNCKPRKPVTLLQRRGQGFEDSPVRNSIEIAHDWARGLYSALVEIQDTALHSSLVKYVKEREQRISSALGDLSFPAPSETSLSSKSSSNGTRSRHNKKIRANGSDFMPKACKEMLMLEKQVDKVMARLCRLISLGPSPDPPIGATKPKPPAAVKPPWTMYETSSRIRLPFRG